jgi:hypothetical protein
MEVTEDPVAGPHDRDRFAVDQEAERVAVAGKDGLDRPAGVEVRGRSIGLEGEVGLDRPSPRREFCRRDGAASAVSSSGTEWS